MSNLPKNKCRKIAVGNETYLWMLKPIVKAKLINDTPVLFNLFIQKSDDTLNNIHKFRLESKKELRDRVCNLTDDAHEAVFHKASITPKDIANVINGFISTTTIPVLDKLDLKDYIAYKVKLNG